MSLCGLAFAVSDRPAGDRVKSSWPPPAPPKNMDYSQLPENVSMRPRQRDVTDDTATVNGNAAYNVLDATVALVVSLLW